MIGVIWAIIPRPIKRALAWLLAGLIAVAGVWAWRSVTRAVRRLWKRQNALRRRKPNVEGSKMTLTKILILCAALGLLASCATPNTDVCAGWRPVRASEATVGYLAENDPAALKAMIAHAEFGRAQGCWR